MRNSVQLTSVGLADAYRIEKSLANLGRLNCDCVCEIAQTANDKES